MMRGLVFLFILLVPGGLLVYLAGCWLLGEKPWDLWKDQVPMMYDGKQSFEEWKREMERARRLQEEEDRD